MNLYRCLQAHGQPDALTRAAEDVERLAAEYPAPAGWSEWYLRHSRATMHLNAAPHYRVEFVHTWRGTTRWQWGDDRTNERHGCGSWLEAVRRVEEMAL